MRKATLASLLIRARRRRRVDDGVRGCLGKARISGGVLVQTQPRKASTQRDRGDPTTMTLAKLIIELVKAGEREPERLSKSPLNFVLRILAIYTESLKL